MIWVLCEHGRAEAHADFEGKYGVEDVCPGDHKALTHELIAALEADGWIVPPLGFDYFKRESAEEGR